MIDQYLKMRGHDPVVGDRKQRHKPDPVLRTGKPLRWKQPWEDWENNTIREHFPELTDTQLAVKVGRTKDAVLEQRRKLNLKRKHYKL